MWEVAVDALRSSVGDVCIVTDGPSDWQVPRHDVIVLPYLYSALRRGFGMPPRVERLVSAPLAWRRAEAIVDGKKSPARRPLSLMHQWKNVVQASQGVVVSGAGAMTDDYAVHGIASWALICEWAAAAQVPVYFVGQGVGPITGEGRRESAKRALQQAGLLTVREPYSHDTAKALGVPDAHLSMTPDWACANVPTRADRAKAEQLHHELADGLPYLAISVHRRGSTTKMDLERLRTATRDLVVAAARRGLRTIIVPNMTGERYNDDRATFDMLASDWPPGVPEAPVLRTQESSRVVRALLGRSEGIVSTRYHPIVFALAEGVGAAGLSFDPYYDQSSLASSGHLIVKKPFSRSVPRSMPPPCSTPFRACRWQAMLTFTTE